MALPDDYMPALELLAKAFEEYHRRTGGHAVLVGGAATAIYTAGAFPSADFDIVAAASDVFDEILLANGFRREDRTGRLRMGFNHSDHPRYGFQQVSGRLFDGKSDPDRLTLAATERGEEIPLPSIEDMIADRLAQHAVASPTDDSRLRQAVLLFQIADELDLDYLIRRVRDEGGDPSLLPGLTQGG